VSAWALLIGFYIVGTNNLAILLNHKGFGWQPHPNSLCFLLINIAVISIGITRRHYLLKDWPDSLKVIILCFADLH